MAIWLPQKQYLINISGGGNDSLSYLNEIMCLILKDWIEQKDLDRNNIFAFFDLIFDLKY